MSSKLTMSANATAAAAPSTCVCGHTNRDHAEGGVCDGFVTLSSPTPGANPPPLFDPCQCRKFVPEENT